MTGEEGTDCPHGHVHSQGAGLPAPWKTPASSPGHLCPAGTACEVQGPDSPCATAPWVPGRSLWGSLSVELPFCFVLT